MQAQPNDALSVSTVLVQDRDQFREMLLARLAKAAQHLHESATWAIHERRSNGVLKKYERSITEQLAEIESCRELLGQIGWRD